MKIKNSILIVDDEELFGTTLQRLGKGRLWFIML